LNKVHRFILLKLISLYFKTCYSMQIARIFKLKVIEMVKCGVGLEHIFNFNQQTLAILPLGGIRLRNHASG